MIGDAGVPGSGSDENYTGDSGGSVFGLQYYRDKATEFQAILNAVDSSAGAAMLVVDANIDDGLTQDMLAFISEFDAKRGLMKGTAEAINFGAASINSFGGRFPSLSIPSGLGVAPLIVPAATIAAIGVAASLIVWGAQWVSGVNERLKLAQISGAVSDPEKRDALLAAVAASDSALSVSSGSGLSNIAGIVKWGAIAFAAYLAFSAFTASQKGR